MSFHATQLPPSRPNTVHIFCGGGWRTASPDQINFVPTPTPSTPPLLPPLSAFHCLCCQKRPCLPTHSSLKMRTSMLLAPAAILAGAAKTPHATNAPRAVTTLDDAAVDLCVMPSPSAATTSSWSAAYPTFDYPCIPQTVVPERPIPPRAPVPGDWTTGYMATCRNCSIVITDPREYRNTLLSCMCLNGHPLCPETMDSAVYVKSELDLNGYFGNNDGYLHFGDRNFLYTCEACNLTCGYWYFCECSYGYGTHYSNINLDLYFWAPYGTLQPRPTAYLPPSAIVPSLDAADQEAQGHLPEIPDGPDGTWGVPSPPVRRSAWSTLPKFESRYEVRNYEGLEDETYDDEKRHVG
ncbi:hypothetical protein MAPG_09204 [Magnaporthiopsis poae ATCC 64411]|uniref:Cyanovirin-N domain-containing protein n=1 Tax=Magnaporthiopsis poae (strain ATCC 64411 / 73-15) TaxID=644358 RepID=A0A0C4E9C4_MAGP6|nr:hypothetical protein MAPG_09204 [Magnaporthiopsis poae ATCC 64411]